jgi:hypothetical protein
VKSELDVYWELRHLRGSLAARTARRTLVFIEFDRLVAQQHQLFNLAVATVSERPHLVIREPLR